MHTKRIIPCLDVKDGRVVKGINFTNLRDAGNPAEVAEAYQCLGRQPGNPVRMGKTGGIQSIYPFYCRGRNPHCRGFQGVAARGRG